MKDHVRSGAIFRIKNKAALKHGRPISSRPSAFSRNGKGSVSSSAKGESRRRVMGLSRANGAFSKPSTGKSASHRSRLLIDSYNSSTAEDEDEDVISSDEISETDARRADDRSSGRSMTFATAFDDEDTSSDDEMLNASHGVPNGSGRLDHYASSESSPETFSSQDRYESLPDSESTLLDTQSQALRLSDSSDSDDLVTGQRKSGIKRKHSQAKSGRKELIGPSRKKRIAVMKRSSSSSDVEDLSLEMSDDHSKDYDSEDESDNPLAAGSETAKKGKKKISAPKAKKRYSVTKPRTDSDSDSDAPVSQSMSAGRSRRSRKPVGQWWAANPAAVDTWHPKAKKQRRSSAPVSRSNSSGKAASKTATSTRAISTKGKKPAYKQTKATKPTEPTEPDALEKMVTTKQVGPSKPESSSGSSPRRRPVKDTTQKKRQKQRTLDDILQGDLPKPHILDESPVLQQSVFAKSSPSKRIASGRIGSRITPLSSKNMNSPHLTPITPARALRVAQALFKLEEEEAERTAADLETISSDSSAVVAMQPLRSSQDEFGMPSIPHSADSDALAEANWYMVQQ